MPESGSCARPDRDTCYRVDAPLGGNGTSCRSLTDGRAVGRHNTIIHSNNVLNVYVDRGSAVVVSLRVPQQHFAAHATGDRPSLARAPTHQRILPVRGLLKRLPGRPRGTLRHCSELEPFSQQFVNYAGQDYRLKSDSELRRAATDGADLGVNFVALVRTIGARAREWLGLAAPTP